MKRSPDGIQEVVASTIKLGAFAAVPAALVALTYGAWTGVKVWLAWMVILVLGEAWVHRGALKDFLRRQ
jgi:hypothetical protein